MESELDMVIELNNWAAIKEAKEWKMSPEEEKEFHKPEDEYFMAEVDKILKKEEGGSNDST